MPDWTLRCWPVTTTSPQIDIPVKGTLEDAIKRAHELGYDRSFMNVIVVDPSLTSWAEFHMLWAFPEAPDA